MNRRVLLDTLAKAGAAVALPPMLARAGAPAKTVLTQALPSVSLTDWAIKGTESSWS